MVDRGSEARRAALVAAYDAAVAADDVDAMAAAALGLTELQEFGPVPGRLPAFLHTAYERSTGRRRVELAIAIARTWSYGMASERAEPFVAEALAAPETQADPALLAAALDAQLLTKWGPRDFTERAAITQQLEDVVAHVADAEVQMSANLWRLTTALEALDIVAVRRQLRGLETLAEETGSDRIRFYASSRRGMYALLIGDLDLAQRALADTVSAGEAAGEPDTFALEHALTSSIARQRGDRETAAREAPVYEQYAEEEGVAVVAAEGALIWVAAGEHDRAARLLRELAPDGFDRVADGVDWLYTVVCLTEVAAALGDRALCERAIEALAPYEGRGVVDAGAVKFAGVVDDYLGMASTVVGANDAAAAFRENAAAAYRRVNANWLLRRLDVTSRDPHPPAPVPSVLRPCGDGVWEVGREGATTQVRELKGLRYLRLLLQRPGISIGAAELSDAVAGHAGAGIREAGTPLLDRRAAVAYRRRLAQLDEAAQVALDDVAKLERIEAERARLVRELRSASGLGGRSRAAGATDERARVAVRKAVANAIGRIAEVDATLARLLADTVSTGASCRYEPDPGRPVTWYLD